MYKVFLTPSLIDRRVKERTTDQITGTCSVNSKDQESQSKK